MSTANLRLVPPDPPKGEASTTPEPEIPIVAAEELEAPRSKRRFAMIAVAVLAFVGGAVAVGLARRHAAPAAGHPAAQTMPPPVEPRAAPPVPGDPRAGTPAPAGSAPSNAPRAHARPVAEDERAPRALADDAPPSPTRAEDGAGDTTTAAPREHHRRGGHHHEHASSAERASRSHHEHAFGAGKHGARKVAAAGDRAAARAAYARGSTALLTGDAGAAASAYAEAVRLAPSDPVGYRGLGLAYEKQGKVQDAISAFVSYLKLSRHARDREVIARRLYRLTHSQ